MRRMKFLAVLTLCVFGTSVAFGAAVRTSVRGGAASKANVVATQKTAGATSTSSRGGTTARSAVAARSATPTKTQSAVSARAATTQKVVNNGTKITTATANTVVSEECKTKYYGCMDSFCMLDNTSGGRCLCSDRNAELDKVATEIQRLDEQTYAMATTGVERIEMGADAEDVIAQANAVAQSFANPNSSAAAKRKSLDMSLWTSTVDFDGGSDGEEFVDVLAGKQGAELFNAVNDLCVQSIPECSSETSMLQLMYSQQIRSDCSAYENSLKQQKNASTQKLAAAESALRDAALEQYRSANKYDLGQCTIEFKKCMITTADCGEDFSKCASVSAIDNTSTRAGKNKDKTYSIKGATVSIDIYATTYDTLVAKKPLCENVLRSCDKVKDKVWDTFLAEVAPQLKSAELIAEDNARQNCVSSISSCFQKACKDNIDPNDPDGSYDLCLTRPETMLNLCKVPLNACGIDTDTKKKNYENSTIWNYVVAVMASMRVDSCTNEVKQCLQSADRCGEDYSQCVGLDTDTIIRMCPYEKMVGCQKVYGEENITGQEVYNSISDIVQGLMLNIDNNMLAQCQKAVDDAMIKVCGDTENCDSLTIDDGVGARSLEYKICKYSNDSSSMDINYNSCVKDVSNISDSELGYGSQGTIVPYAGVIDGTIYWESVSVTDDGRLSNIEEYMNSVKDNKLTASQTKAITEEFGLLQRSVNNAISAIESDPTVQYCMTGREVQGMRVGDKFKNIGDKSRGGRFPQLTQQMRSVISMSALKMAKKNYYAKYDELNEKMLQDYAKIGERVAELQGKNRLDARREIARQACVSFSEMSVIPTSPEPPKGAGGKIMAAVAIVGAAVAIPFTGGLSIGVATGTIAGLTTTGVTVSSGVAVAVAGAAVAGIGIAADATSGGGNGSSSSGQLDLVGSAQHNEWNFKETITSTFEWETLKCHKCTTSQNCANTRRPAFGKPWCKDWADPVETCTDTQF